VAPRCGINEGGGVAAEYDVTGGGGARPMMAKRSDPASGRAAASPGNGVINAQQHIDVVDRGLASTSDKVTSATRR